MTKKPQFLGLKNSPSSTNSRVGPKASHLNQMLNAMNSNQQDRESLYAKKKLFEDAAASSKSMNLGSNKFLKSPNGAMAKKKLEVDTEPLQEPLFNISNQPKSPYQFNSGPRTTMNKQEKPRFPSTLSPIDGSSDNEKGGNVNIDLIIKLDEKLREIFENNDNKTALIPYLKDYLEAVDKEEVIHVESLFFDTRMRRNLKTYMMLEKTSMFAILAMINDEGPAKDSQEMHLRNICHYVYSNFLNFVDTLVSKLELLPRYNQTSFIEKLKNLTKGKAQDVDRSFGLEQINKLLIKVLRTSLKQTLQKKSERYPKVDLILEKTEFGLMLNYFDELKITFQDLLQKHKIEVAFAKTPSEPESATDNSNTNTPLKKRPSKPEKPKLSPSSTKLSPLDHSPLKSPTQKEYHLPPPVPKEGQEHRPVYSLVLDMDETLIHFEEVGGKGRFFVRPYAEKFLKEMSELYEVTIFTAGVKDYADAVLNILDPHGYITHRLYRHHTTLKPSVPGVIKDLSKLGRDLTKTLLVDNAPENFRLQQENGLEIISWYNDPYDTELLDMMPFLKDLVLNQVEDIRKPLKKYKEKKRYKRH